VCLSGTTEEQGVPTDRLHCYIKHNLIRATLMWVTMKNKIKRKYNYKDSKQRSIYQCHCLPDVLGFDTSLTSSCDIKWRDIHCNGLYRKICCYSKLASSTKCWINKPLHMVKVCLFKYKYKCNIRKCTMVVHFCNYTWCTAWKL